ncbi:MAG: DUF488 domain-containing protein [Opitutaceae bacterium]|nr:DUF488 domain-containing protein [Opitutaceae bacterium]
MSTRVTIAATPKTPSRTESNRLQIKRAYDPAAKTDGMRLLVERLWPRGIKKEALRLDGWLKDAAPSTELRLWFSHDPAKWPEFQRRYEAELKQRPDAWQPILDAAKQGKVTLLFSSHDAEHNNVVALRRFLKKRAKRRASPAAAKTARVTARSEGFASPPCYLAEFDDFADDAKAR